MCIYKHMDIPETTETTESCLSMFCAMLTF